MGKLATTLTAPAEPLRSPEREKLAIAIANHEAAAAELERIRAAQQRHFEDVRLPASKALAAAQKALGELQASELRAMASAYLGDADEAARLADARHAVDAAQAAVENGAAVKQGLEAYERAALVSFETAKRVLDEAHVAAVKASPEMAALVERYEAARRQAAVLMRVMASTFGFHSYQYPDSYDMIRTYDDDLNREAAAEIDAWQEALARLRENADEPLPT